MPYAVGFIGVISFLAGLAVAGERYVTAGFLVAVAAGVSLWLRWFVTSSIEQAFQKGAGYGVSTRARIRALHEVATVPNGPLDKKRFLTHPPE